MTTTATPIHRMRPADRREHAEQFVGMLAVVVVDRLRGAGAAVVLRGRVLAVAASLTGAATDVIIVRHRTQAGGLTDYAASLATVESITPVAGS